MTEPENTESVAEAPADPTPEAVVEVPVQGAEPVVAEPEETPEEAASDAALRAWAKDNGLEGVPTAGRLSAAWRDQITAAMAVALDPKDAGTAEVTSSESPTPVETMTETTPEPSGGEPPTAQIEKPKFGPGSDQPEFAHGGTEYRSVWKAPDTWVHSQVYTA